MYSYDEALEKFEEFFQKEYPENYSNDFFGDPNEPGGNLIGGWNNADGFYDVVKRFIIFENENSYQIPYTMAWGMSDIFCIDKGSLFEFSRLCGIFSAMNLFVEIAIPTAVVLMFQREEVSFFPDEGYYFLWGEDRTRLEEFYNRDFSRLCEGWDSSKFFIHPVKLSGWKVE